MQSAPVQRLAKPLSREADVVARHAPRGFICRQTFERNSLQIRWRRAEKLSIGSIGWPPGRRAWVPAVDLYFPVALTTRLSGRRIGVGFGGAVVAGDVP